MAAGAQAAGKRERKAVERLVQAPAPVIKKKAKAPKAKAAKATAKKSAKPAKAEKKPKKDPNAPKRGLSAFMFFGQEMRAKIIKENPNLSFGEVGKKMGADWAKCKDKSKYEKKAEADKARYEKEKAKYEAKGSKKK